ncbi:hypothetical protein CRENBAI_024305 [Crenichthys baileyi]|uniref:C2H2-type domain-containing protein n=1 Tax=Crenichthys baileyi TaxID=28760 RepID=A0AAV9S9E9_9TELE
MKENPAESSAEPSKADSLRGFVTERLAAASREILAAVGTVVAAYEEEALGFRLEIHRQRKQLELLQNQVAVRTDGLPSSRSHGSSEEEEGNDCLKSRDQTGSSSSSSSQAQSDRRKPGRPQISKAQNTIDLSIRILKDSKIRRASRNVVKKCPLVSLKCPRGLQGLDFLNLLRSAVPQLAGDNKSFDILTLDRKRRLQPLTLKTVTAEEIIRKVRSTGLRKLTFYIRLKEEIPRLQTEISSDSLACEETKQQGEMTTSEQDMETEEDHLTSASGEDSLAPSAAERERDAVDEGDTSKSDSSWKLHAGDEDKEKSDSKLITEKEEVDQSNEVWTRTKKRTAGFSCKVCKAAQKSEVALIKHAWRHTEEAGSVCGVCGESDEVIKDHFQVEHRTDDCPTCGESFLSVLSLNEHLKVHSGERPHQHEANHSSLASGPHHECPTCHKVFKLEAQLKAHHRTHSRCKTYLCGVCGKFLSSNRSLSRHKMTHSGERPHRCQICERGFKLATTLRQHEKIHTHRERPYLCDVCCKMFLTSKQLVIHMRTHTNEKPYRCDRCGKGFTTRGPLTIHMRVHTGETPYRCPHCGWSFKRKTHLDDHVAIHTGAKPYVCGICGKTCARRTYLTVHMRTHNGERPYKCSLCDKAFTQSHCLKTHMKSHKAAQTAS